MRHGLTLAPCGLVIERIDPDGDALVIFARPSVRSASCPACGILSSRIHSKYQRRLADLPSQGRLVRIRLWCRRFRCVTAGCCRKIFTERLTATGARPFARRTMRLDAIVHHLGLTLGGRPGQGFARRLLLPVSNDTLLRTVRRRAPNLTTSPKVIGIDDWAFRRGHRYGTIVCDLERRRLIDLLPDREAATVTSWLKNHPGIEVITRDRGAAYIQAATEGRPDAVQVADRWHLMENASAAFLAAVQQSMPAIRTALDTRVIDPALLTSAERRQHDGWQRRAGENAEILGLAQQGVSIKEIVRRTGRSRKLVRTVVRGGRTDVFRGRISSLDRSADALEIAWQSGCRNGAALWRLLRTRGFRGGLRVVTEWATRRRNDARASSDGQPPRKPPSARQVAKLMTKERAAPPPALARSLAVIQAKVPDLVAARDLMDRFHALIRQRDSGKFETWLAEASSGLLSSFSNGIATDKNAVLAALTHPWSNGQTEGQNTKLKLVKRQMYGRAKLDLLRARLLGAP